MSLREEVVSGSVYGSCGSCRFCGHCSYAYDDLNRVTAASYQGGIGQGFTPDVADGDQDGDGATNLAEYQAGTDPGSSSSLPSIASVPALSTLGMGLLVLAMLYVGRTRRDELSM